MSDDSSSSSSDLQEEEEEKEPKSSLSTDGKGVKNGERPKKKKKKNAPDRPQPAWLFPPDAENPVLNPKHVSEEEMRKTYEARIEAIRFLRYRSVSAPMKTAPPSQLLTLIGGFLASYGFISTGQIFTLERNARKKLDGWDDKVGAKLEAGMPDLLKIYKDWSKEWHERRELGAPKKPIKDSKAQKSGLKPSSSANESTSGIKSGQLTTNGAVTKSSVVATTLEPPLMNGRTSSTDSSTTIANSSSASDPKSHDKGATSSKSSTSDSEVPAPKKNNDATSSESSTSDSEVPAPKKNNDATSSESSTSDSEVPAPKKKSAAPKPTKRKRSPSPKPSTPNTAGAKVPKKTNTPFSRIPQDTKVDPKLASNAYVPYDYAEKAHQDLIVTKGKGFTKEKNKKKKGAYRGGVIDVGGGKGIKFDD
ncbi:hypothetical protein MMC26_000162 [Xylographa opegraphella]|nr:hypothetical protein [Xylographa opegraphella]